jgi:hypothetical protein
MKVKQDREAKTGDRTIVLQSAALAQIVATRRELDQLREAHMVAVKEYLPADAIRHKDFCEKYGIALSTLAFWIEEEEDLVSYRVSHKERYVSEAVAVAVLRKRRPEN